MKTTYLSALLLSSMVILNSCSSDEVKSTDNENATEESVNETSEVNKNTEEQEVFEDSFEFIPPSTIQIASMFKKAGLDYNASNLNPIENQEKYLDNFKQSLNFGVYSSDLANCVLNNETSKAKIYLKALKDISAKIGLETVMADGDILKRFEDNIDNQDSIINILFYVHENTDDYIVENGKQDLNVIYYTGAWIEGMYFGALKALETTDKFELGILISEQMIIAESIYGGLTHLSHPSIDTEDLASSINEIIDTYNGFESVKSLGDDAAFLDVILNDGEIEIISNLLIELRTSTIG